MEGYYRSIQSDKTKLHFNFRTKSWHEKPIEASLYNLYNPIRFLALWYVSKKYEKSHFHKVLFLKAKLKNIVPKKL